MAFSAGNVFVFKIDSTDGGALTDISSYTKTPTMQAERDILELPRGGGNAIARLVGPVGTTYELEGWWDPTLDEIFESAINASSPVTRTYEYYPAGSATGARKYAGECYVASYEVDTDAEEAASWKATLVVDGANTQTVVP